MKQKFTTHMLSLLLAASMSVPAVSPIFISAQDFEEVPADGSGEAAGTQQSSQEGTALSADEEGRQMLEYANANGIQPMADDDMTGDTVVIDLDGSCSSDLSVPVYPWAKTTVSKDVTDQSGFITVNVDFQKLLAELPDIFEKQVGWWSNAKLWPLVTKVNDQEVNGMPIDLNLTLPEGYTLSDNYTVDDQTTNTSYKWADYGSDNLLSSTSVTTSGNTAKIDLNIGYIQYGTLLKAITDGKIGSWSVKIPVTCSAKKGDDISAAKMDLTGTAGSPYHMTGLGIGLKVPVEITPAQAPVLTGVPEEPVGIVDDTVDVSSSVKVNGQDTALTVFQDSALSIQGSLDVKNIKDKLNSKIEKYGVLNQLDKVPVPDVDLQMLATIDLPEQAVWNGDASSVAFAGDITDFKITGVEKNGNQLQVAFALTDTSKISTLKDLVDIMSVTPDTMTIDVNDITAASPVTSAPVAVNVTGDFNADVVIPSTANNPGYYDVHYKFIDTANASVDLTINPIPVSQVNEVIPVASGLTVNGKTGNVTVTKGEALSLVGSLDVTPIKQTLEEKIDKYNVGELLEKVNVKDVDLEMTTTLSLPEQVVWNQKADSVAFAPASKDFKITSVSQKGQVLIISFMLANPDSITTLSDLNKIMQDTPDQLKIQISGLTAEKTVSQAKLTANVHGQFNAEAFIPHEGTNPGLYDITYKFEDYKKATVGLTIEEKKPDQPVVKKVALYRLYNPNSGEHLYTKSERERDYLIKAGWNNEGIGWESPEKSDRPVYRLYNPNAGDHHYTLDENERNVLIKAGWKNEGIAFYSLPDGEGIPVYRAYNPNAKEAGAHNYTTSVKENDYLLSVGWLGEGVGWRAYK